MRRWISTFGTAALLVTVISTPANADPPGGPPAYVSFPHLERLEDVPQAQRGQFVAGPDGLMPAPFVPTVEPMSDGYTLGTSAGTNTVSGTTDSTNALDSYGENRGMGQRFWSVKGFADA